jgi:hypothetical protein
MKSVANNLFQYFDIVSFSKKYLKPEIVNEYHAEYLEKNNKRTRSDCKIFCNNMILFIVL